MYSLSMQIKHLAAHRLNNEGPERHNLRPLLDAKGILSACELGQLDEEYLLL